MLSAPGVGGSLRNRYASFAQTALLRIVTHVQL
jgi:hypothetical protein